MFVDGAFRVAVDVNQEVLLAFERRGALFVGHAVLDEKFAFAAGEYFIEAERCIMVEWLEGKLIFIKSIF